MAQQHTENLFRRYKGQLLNIRTISGGLHKGTISEITNDYVCLTERNGDEETQAFIFFQAIESIVVTGTSS